MSTSPDNINNATEQAYISLVIWVFLFISHSFWLALVPFLLLTSWLLEYNQEIMWTNEHLPFQRPKNRQQLRHWHWSTCRYSFKTLDAINPPPFSANVHSLNKLIRYENCTSYLEIWSQDFQDINLQKLFKGIPFFKIGKSLISILDRKIAKQPIAISRNPCTFLKTVPSGLKLCRNLLVRSVS